MVARPTSVRSFLGPLSVGALLALAGCSNPNVQPSQTSTYNSKWETYNQPQQQSVFGTGNPLGNILGIGGSSKAAAAAASGVGVNTYLWRASLDTISFMPLASEDPFGGVIITDWYSPPQTPDERFKVNVFILDKDLHADGLKATVFRQTRTDGNWVDSPVDEKTAQNLEDSILTRARQLRVATAEIIQQKQ